MNKIINAFKLARWHYTPVIIIPVILGTLLAAREGHPISWMDFFLCLAGAWFAHLGANAANDVFDDINGVDRIAFEKIPENRGSTVCGSEILTSGTLSRKEGFLSTGAFFFAAFSFGFPLFIKFGWPIFFMALSGFLLGVLYCAKPIAFGYIGRGLGEIAIFIAFGTLPVMGAYWVQTGGFSLGSLMASLPPGFFTVSVLYNSHFSHFSADAEAGKISPVVALGERGARMISPLILAAGYLSILINVVMGVFPKIALAGLLTAPFIFKAYMRLKVPSDCRSSNAFLFNVVKTNIATGFLILLSIVFGLMLK